MTASHSPSYLVRNHYSYCFRMAVPKDLRPTISKKELRYSLGTVNLSAAKNKARYMAGQVQVLFRKLRNGMSLTKEQIHQLIKTYRDSLFEGYDKPIPYEHYNEVMSLGEPIERETEYQWINGYREWLLDALAAGNYTTENIPDGKGGFVSVEQKADALLVARGTALSEINKSTSEYSELCQGIIGAELKGLDRYEQKLNGQFSGELEALLSDSHTPLPLPDQNSSDVPLPKKPTKTIGQILADYLDEGAREGKWTEKTQTEVEAGMRLLVEYFGDVPIATLDRKMMGQYRRDLWKLPPNRNKAKAYRDLTVPELVALDLPPEQCIKELTVRDYLSRANTLLEYARLNGEIASNPVEGLTIKRTKRDDENRDIFTPEDLRRIFSAEQYQNDSFQFSYQFWTPLLALLTGARLNEMAQLHLSDFEEHEGVWCLKLAGDTEDKRLKNRVSRRLIPLHPTLVDDLNIIARVRWLKNHGEERFFPELKLSRDGYGRAVSRWFSGFLKPIGVYVKHRKTFHSFRHTFATNLAYNDVNDHSLKALKGHSEDSITFGTYVKRGTPTKLYNTLVNHLKYDLNLDYLKGSKWVIK